MKLDIPTFVLILFSILFITILLGQHAQKQNALWEYEEEKGSFTYLKKLQDNGMPFLWIHVPYEYNTRHWQSFYGRGNTQLNQPYLVMCSQNIVVHCYKSFNICFVTDESFQKTIPGWNIQMSRLPDPVLSYVRTLGMMKILNLYGGIIVPIAFCCFKNLLPIYEKAARTNQWCMFPCKSTNKSWNISPFMPDYLFSAAPPNHPTVQLFIEYIQRQISKDYTAETEFVGCYNKWCQMQIKQKNNVQLLDGKQIGLINTHGTFINLEQYFTPESLHLQSDMYGLILPRTEILESREYQWFARYSYEQIMNSNMIICKYLSALPKSQGTHSISLKEEMRSQAQTQSEKAFVEKNVGFWEVPSGIRVYGLKPDFLGNNMIMKKD